MKTINKLLIFFIFFTLISCKKQLDRQPYNAVSDELAFKTVPDFDNAVRGMYRRMIGFVNTAASGNTPTSGYYAGSNGSDMIILPDLLADNLITSQAGRATFRETSRWIYDPNNNVPTLFRDAYSIIRISNAILANINNGILSGAQKDNYQGEALAVRAWMHFDLARMYCKAPLDPTINPAVDFGMAYVTSLNAEALPARESIANTYNKIVADLVQAEALISGTNSVASGRWHRAAVAGLLAKVYLYMGRWQDAVDAATRSLNLNGNIGNMTDLANIWKDATNNGVLFKLRILDADRITPGVSYSQTTGTAVKSEYVCTYDLYQLYDTTDIRKTVYIQKSPFSGVNQLHIAKYFGRVTGNKNTVDVKVLRVADVLLIRAEANAKLNNTVNAVTDLNTLKKNRYNPYIAYTFTNQPALLDEIWKERRLELAFEGDRFYDLKRRNLDVMRNPNFGDRADGTGTKFPPDAVTLMITDHKMQLPFPDAEPKVNTNFKQNPGY